MVVVKGTGVLSSIHIENGLSAGAEILINSGEGDFDAAGQIYVGPLTWSTLPNITFDGSIKIDDDAPNQSCNGEGGELTGRITIVGCHADDTDLNICVDGGDNGYITIIQDNCTHQVDYSCGGCL